MNDASLKELDDDSLMELLSELENLDSLCEDKMEEMGENNE